MARFQLIISDEERERFSYQAGVEGMTLSAWLRAAAHERLKAQQSLEPFSSQADLDDFFSVCDGLEGDKPEPDWEQHLDAISRSRSAGESGT